MAALPPQSRRRNELYDERWKAARLAFLQRHPLCVECQRGGRLNAFDPITNPRFVVDHIRPHRGCRELFWDQRNWQVLCKPCHDSVKQRIEKSGEYGCDEDGNPLSPGHHWR